MENDQKIIESYLSYIEHEEFPCIAAKAALAKQQIKCFVAFHMACPNDDKNILNFLYTFIEEYRASPNLFHSAAIIFKGPMFDTEIAFDNYLWKRLQALTNLDAKNYKYDDRVDNDPNSPSFSFSLKEEAFFIIGLHPNNNRHARVFDFPTLVFNPHKQFEQLRETARLEKMKKIVRQRDLVTSGSVNPMLEDYGESSEVFQYSGRKYDEKWHCPLIKKHATN